MLDVMFPQPFAFLVKNQQKVFRKGRQHLEGNWFNLLSITLKVTNPICLTKLLVLCIAMEHNEPLAKASQG